MTPTILQFDQLHVEIYPDQDAAGRAGAEYVGSKLQEIIAEKGDANIILATGNSQLAFLRVLCSLPGIEWNKVRIFHMDEYVGISPTHPASFVRYIQEKVVDLVQPLAFFPIRGDTGDPQAVCDEYEKLLKEYPADICCMGIGENGHLAFNEPHDADFEDPKRVRLITLDERSRRQQVGEGHFATIDEVPKEAITLTIPALLAARHVVVQVPEARKAEAVSRALFGPIHNECPASILRTCSHARLYLDRDSGQDVLARLEDGSITVVDGQ